MTTAIANLEHAQQHSGREYWLRALCYVLLGYALLGKGFAYFGLPPLFIGEIILAAGIGWLVLFGRWPNLPPRYLFYPLVGLMIWGLLQTIPYVSVYGMDALRDAVLWAYAAIALVLFWHILQKPERLAYLLAKYKVFATLYLVTLPIAWTVRYLALDKIPRWPWADVPMVFPKAGDVMVHVGGILAFWIAGFEKRVGLVRLLLLTACAAVIGAYERAGMFAFLGVYLLGGLVRPRQKQLHQLAAIGVLGLSFLAVTNLRFEVPVAEWIKVREVSFDQFIQNITSVVGSSDLGDLDDTKAWRLQWWEDIINYTVFGDYRWTGKGFGINLADESGFQVMADGSLRSPHNAHMTILARAGVPGLVLWLLVHFGWAIGIWRAYLRSGRDGQKQWESLFLFLLLYWSAFMVNASFDVFLEGPMGGIWYWSLYGVGMAALWLWQNKPETLATDANTPGA